MKKIITLLLTVLTAYSFTSKAQTTVVCNADFNFAISNTFSVQFTPVMVGDSFNTVHYWSFGDGNTVSAVAPSHTYAAVGSFSVKHYIVKHNPNGVVLCTDTVTKVILIQQTTACTLQAYFTYNADSLNWNTIHFQNQSQPNAPGDSIRWTFGDGSAPINGLVGTLSTPTHVYANAGAYNVCIRVKKNNNTTGTPCVSEICKTVIVAPPCNLVANFNWTTTASSPLVIAFHNLSVPLAASDSVSWTFGDGTVSLDVNPTHTYANAGTYTVCLRVKKNITIAGVPACVSEICKTVVVVTACNLQADFSSQADSLHPLRVKLTNLSVVSSAADSVRWTFGDGTSVSGLQSDPNIANPTHDYAQGGAYTVCLRVKKNITIAGVPACVSEICKTVVVVTVCNLQANFSSQADSLHPLRVKFTNLSVVSSAADSVRWTFGDGTSVSGLQSDPNIANPTHDYAQGGAYTVCLRVKRNNNTPGTTPCVGEICRSITVIQPCNIPASFTMHRDSANIHKVYFTNTTIAPTASAIAKWSFGDGTFASTWNAVHEYAQAGTYRVCLTVYFSTNCVKETCDTVVIPNPPPSCLEISKFTFEKFSTDNQKYKFTPDHIATDIVYTWTFGDGTGSHDPIAIHRYAQAGVYVACLTAWRGPNCASTTCKEIRVLPQINCDSIHVSYSYQKDPFVSNKLYFYANANFPILDQTWTISKLSPATTPPVILHQNNPIYVFNDTGYYRVCLKAITLGGCVKEYCSVIHIEHVVTNVCELQAFPNPTTTLVNVNVSLTAPGMIDGYIYNTMNTLVKEKHQQGVVGNNIVTFNINDLIPGLYTIKVVYGGKTCYARFTKL